MKHTLLNLNEGSFPIQVDKKYTDLQGLEGLGAIKDPISVKLRIERFSKVLFLAKGSVSVTLESDCQTCFKNQLP